MWTLFSETFATAQHTHTRTHTRTPSSSHTHTHTLTSRAAAAAAAQQPQSPYTRRVRPVSYLVDKNSPTRRQQATRATQAIRATLTATATATAPTATAIATCHLQLGLFFLGHRTFAASALATSRKYFQFSITFSNLTVRKVQREQQQQQQQDA